MKKTFAFFLLGLLLITNHAKSQNITAPANTIEALLCKQWVIDYALMNGVRQKEIPAEEKNIMITFKKNKTFIMLMGGKNTDKGEGTWQYDPAKKIVKLIIHESVGIIVTGLSETELTMKFNIRSNMKEDNMRLVYKVKTN